MGALQSSHSIILISLGTDTTVLTEASSRTWKNMSARIEMLQAAAFARSSALVFLFLSMYSTVNPLK
jgi:hypothetical protein